MSTELWIALIASALGTLFLRLMPLIWMQRHLLRRKTEEGDVALPSWLSVFGPVMIAAMFGVSLVPQNTTPSAWGATVAGCLVTFIVWRKTQSLGWPVFAGVFAYGTVAVIF